MATASFEKNNERPIVGINLLFICEGFQGGTYRYAKEMVVELARQKKWRLLVYCQKDAFKLEHVFECVSIYETGTMRNRVYRIAFEQLILPLLAMTHRIDVMFSPGFVSPLFGRFKKIATIHDLYYKKYPGFVRWSQRLYWRLMVPPTLRVCDIVVAVSDSTKRDIKEAFPWVGHKLVNIYHGVSHLSDKKCSRRGADSYVLFVGYITQNKNIGVLISALQMLSNDGIRCELKVAGKDIYGLLETELRQLGDKQLVKIYEGAGDDELACLYQRALCLVIPSVYEGFGLPALEAMDNGCPVVSSGAGGLEEVIGSSGIYFRHNSPAELAAAIRWLISDEELRETYIERGYINAKRFSWDQAAKQLAHCFGILLNH